MQVIDQLVSKLYPKDPQSARYVKKIVYLIQQTQLRRPQWLRQWDNQLSPNWYIQSDHIIYSLYADLFSPEAKPGEYLAALTAKLDYFVELGVSTIHVLPIFKASGDNGFAVDDYQEVDPRFGSRRDLSNFIKQAHRRKLKIAFDFVLNHTSDNHSWAQQAKQGNAYYRDYYITDSTHTGKPWPKVLDVFYEFAPGHWDYVPELNDYVWATFYLRRTTPGEPARYPFAQWDLNYRNPEVLLAMLEQLLLLANRGIDLFRLDAASFIWKERGTNCLDLPEGHRIIQLFRYALQQVAPKTVILGELEGTGSALARYVRHSNEMQLYYQFALEEALWHAVMTTTTTKLKQIIQQLPVLDAQHRMVVVDECHDQLSLGHLSSTQLVQSMLRYYTRRRRGLPQMFKVSARRWSYGVCGTRRSMVDGNIKKIQLLDRVKFTLGGVPLIYMGQELGVKNDYSFQRDQVKMQDHRFVKRVAITPSLVQQRTKLSSQAQQIFSNIQQLVQLRQQHPVLATNHITLLRLSNPHILGYYKQAGRARLTVVHNFSNRWQTVMISGTTVTLAPYASTWF